MTDKQNEPDETPPVGFANHVTAQGSIITGPVMMLPPVGVARSVTMEGPAGVSGGLTIKTNEPGSG